MALVHMGGKTITVVTMTMLKKLPILWKETAVVQMGGKTMPVVMMTMRKKLLTSGKETAVVQMGGKTMPVVMMTMQKKLLTRGKVTTAHTITIRMINMLLEMMREVITNDWAIPCTPVVIST